MNLADDALQAQLIQQAQMLIKIASQAINQGSAAECQAAFTLLVPKFADILKDAKREHTDILVACYGNLYFLAWRGCDELTSLTSFSDAVSKPFGAFIRETWESKTSRELLAGKDATAPMKLAYICSAAQLKSANAIPKVIFAFLAGHATSSALPLELTVYLLSKPDNIFLNAMSAFGANVVDVSDTGSASGRADTVVNHARSNRIDAIVCDEPGAIQSIIYQRRAAPVQAFAEMGFAPWGIEGLDICFSGISQDEQSLKACCNKVVPTKRPVIKDSLITVAEPEQIDALRAQLLELLDEDARTSEDALIYGFYGRIVKISEDYLNRAEQILQHNQNAVLFIGGTGNGKLINTFLSGSPVRSRIHFINSFVPGQVIAQAIDVFLDSDPFPGGVSCLECQIRSVPVIWRAGFGDQTLGLLADMRDPSLSAETDEEYVSKAVELANTELLAEARIRALSIAEETCDYVGAARQIETALRDELEALRSHAGET
ncbi:hypothetical protein [Coralliovum pocilloporae]|uniref:hypothetical protein n=1 Tax=Coralliovum pocilloporae TaxID=3066369 RepID=UPI00330715C0